MAGRVLYGPMSGTRSTLEAGRSSPAGARAGQALAWLPRNLRQTALGLCALVLFAAALPAGCTLSNDAPGTPVYDEAELEAPPVRRTNRVFSTFGGAHRRLEVRDGTWFQAFANRLVFLDALSGAVLADLELAPRGTTGSLVDFVLDGKLAYCLLEDDEVVEVEISNVREPRILARYTKRELGIAPRRISLIGDEIFVSGEGGVVLLSEARPSASWVDEKGLPVPPVVPEPRLAGRLVGVVVAGPSGPVACVGRRVLALEDGSYLGAASELAPLPAALGEGFIYILQAEAGAEVGILGPDFRVRSSAALRGTVHSARIFDDRFFAVNDFEVATWKLEPTPADASDPGSVAGASLGALLSVPVRGARDIGKVQRNRFAVAGSFGRSLYRYLPEGDLPGDEFYWSERFPSRLEVCVSDRRRVLAAGPEGTWMYLIGDAAETSTREIASPDRPIIRADASWGVAEIGEDRTTVSFRIGDRVQTYVPNLGAKVNTLLLADGKIWVGHQRGIDVVGFDPVAKEIVAEDRIRLDGPIVGLYPNRVGGGVTYVASIGGFGVVRPLDEKLPPPPTPNTLDGLGERTEPIRLRAPAVPDDRSAEFDERSKESDGR